MNERERTRAKILGVLLRDARLHAGRRPEECAAALGIEPERIEAYEIGEAVPPLPHLEALAVFLKVPLAHFWGNQTVGHYPVTDLEGFVRERQAAIGLRLQELREGQGRTPEEVAQDAGVPAEKISAQESGVEGADLFALEQIAAALGQSLNTFLDEEHDLLANHEAAQKELRRFEEMPADMRAFVTEPINRSYLEIAMRLSRLDVNELRSVAENILNITF